MAMDDALELVRLRNNFYRDNYRRLILGLLGSLVAIIILILVVFYLFATRPAPIYFATNQDGIPIRIAPLNEPILSESTIRQWANTAAVATYTYTFVNYEEQLNNNAKPYFTVEAWRSFWAFLVASRNLKTVETLKLVVNAVATGAPVIVNEGLLDGRYAWRVQIPMLVTYQSASERLTEKVSVTLLIVRVPTLMRAEGIAIAQFIAQPAGNTEQNS